MPYSLLKSHQNSVSVLAITPECEANPKTNFAPSFLKLLNLYPKPLMKRLVFNDSPDSLECPVNLFPADN